LVLHIVPFAAFDFGRSLSLDEVLSQRNSFAPIGGVARDYKITFDGYIAGSNNEGLSKPQRAYVQVFRTGIVEAVASSLATGKEGKWLVLPEIQAMIIKYARSYAISLQKLGMEPPFAIMASLAEVKGKRFLPDFPAPNSFPEDMRYMVIGKEQLHFVETIFESVPQDDKSAAKQLKYTLDHLANAGGLPSSPYFDDNGDYTLKI
jgi:hypothetical protein